MSERDDNIGESVHSGGNPSDADLVAQVRKLDALLAGQQRALGDFLGQVSTPRDEDDDMATELEKLAQSEAMLRREMELLRQGDMALGLESGQNTTASFNFDTHRVDQTIESDRGMYSSAQMGEHRGDINIRGSELDAGRSQSARIYERNQNAGPVAIDALGIDWQEPWDGRNAAEILKADSVEFESADPTEALTPPVSNRKRISSPDDTALPPTRRDETPRIPDLAPIMRPKLVRRVTSGDSKPPTPDALSPRMMHQGPPRSEKASTPTPLRTGSGEWTTFPGGEWNVFSGKSTDPSFTLDVENSQPAQGEWRMMDEYPNNNFDERDIVFVPPRTARLPSTGEEIPSLPPLASSSTEDVMMRNSSSGFEASAMSFPVAEDIENFFGASRTSALSSYGNQEYDSDVFPITSGSDVKGYSSDEVQPSISSPMNDRNEGKSNETSLPQIRDSNDLLRYRAGLEAVSSSHENSGLMGNEVRPDISLLMSGSSGQNSEELRPGISSLLGVSRDYNPDELAIGFFSSPQSEIRDGARDELAPKVSTLLSTTTSDEFSPGGSSLTNENIEYHQFEVGHDLSSSVHASVKGPIAVTMASLDARPLDTSSLYSGIYDLEERKCRVRWPLNLLLLLVVLLTVTIPTGVVLRRESQEEKSLVIPGYTAAPKASSAPSAISPSIPTVPTGASSKPTDSTPSRLPDRQSENPMQPTSISSPSSRPSSSPSAGTFSPSLSAMPTVTNQGLFLFLVSISLDGGSALYDRFSPQFRAYQWLAGNQKIDSYSNDRIIQRYVLATFYYSTGGDAGIGWTEETLWMSDEDECNWFSRSVRLPVCGPFGVFQELALSYNNLEGTVPQELALLSGSLTCIDIGGGPQRAISGTLPSELGYLVNLREFRIQSNSLSGKIPYEYGQWKSLESFDVSNNRLSGSVGSWIGSWRSLLSLQLQGNNFTGSIPDAFGELQNLEYLVLDDNGFEGTPPSSFRQLQMLRQLSIVRNKLTGISPMLFSLNRLQFLELDDNQIQGTLSDKIMNLRELLAFSVARNKLVGRIPTTLGQVQKLTQLDLSGNLLTGVLPHEIGDIDGDLRVLNLSSNFLEGTIPSKLSNLKGITTLRLDKNSFTGTMPFEVCNLANQTFPRIYVDCDEVYCPCCDFCCRDSTVDCSCRYQNTELVWRCY